jgi:hypothetical protein
MRETKGGASRTGGVEEGGQRESTEQDDKDSVEDTSRIRTLRPLFKVPLADTMAVKDDSLGGMC